MQKKVKAHYLSKTKKLCSAQVHRWMKTEATPTWTQSLVEVNSKPTVDMSLTSIINPWDSKDNRTFRFQQPLHSIDITSRTQSHLVRLVIKLISKCKFSLEKINQAHLKFFEITLSKAWTTSCTDCKNSGSWGSLFNAASTIDPAVFDIRAVSRIQPLQKSQ